MLWGYLSAEASLQKRGKEVTPHTISIFSTTWIVTIMPREVAQCTWVWGFHSSVAEDSVLLGYSTVVHPEEHNPQSCVTDKRLHEFQHYDKTMKMQYQHLHCCGSCPGHLIMNLTITHENDCDLRTKMC